MATCTGVLRDPRTRTVGGPDGTTGGRLAASRRQQGAEQRLGPISDENRRHEHEQKRNND
jgi:hypothetical protein